MSSARGKMLMDLFVARTDTYAIETPEGWVNMKEPLTLDVIRRHESGEFTAGTYQIDPVTNTVKWLCLDFDDEDKEKAKGDMMRVRDHILEKGYCGEESLPVEYTGRRYHLWMCFAPPIPAVIAYYMGRKFESEAKVKCEVFPKQKVIKTEDFGNLVRLPLGIHRGTGERSTFIVGSLETIRPITVPPEEVSQALEEAQRRERGWMERIEYEGKGYSGEDPPCVLFWLSGVDPGKRNEVAIRLASYYRNFVKLDIETTLARMQKWNSGNVEPLPETEIENVVRSAEKGGYNYSCDDEFWKRGCDITKCPIKVQEFPIATGQVKQFSEKANARVDKLIAGGPIGFIHFLQQCNEFKMAGEWKNRLFIAQESAAVIQRTMMVSLVGQNAVGKRMLLLMIPQYLGEDRVIRFGMTTANILKRKIAEGLDPKGKMFILAEERGDEKVGMTAKYQFEIAYSDEGMNYDFLVPDGQGGWESVHAELKGPLGFMTTSAEVETSGHSTSRESTVTPDSSIEQSNLIYWWQRWRDEVPLSFLKKEEEALEVLQAYYARLRPFKNIINAPEDYIRFGFKSVADRRKWPEFLGWMKDAAILFQPWLPKDEETDSLIILPYIYDFISIISDEIIAQSRGGTTEDEQNVYDFLEKHPELFSYTTKGQKPKIFGKEGFERQDEEPTCFKTSELTSAFGSWKERWIRELLKGLVLKGFLQGHGGRQSRVYSYPLVIGSDGLCRRKTPKDELIPKFKPISGEEFDRQSDSFVRELQEYAEHKLEKELPSLTDHPYCRCEIKPEDCLFQPEWPGSREFIRQRGLLPMKVQEGEKVGKETEKPGLRWAHLSILPETTTDTIIGQLVRHGTRGQKHRGKAKRTRRPRSRKAEG
jgi:hypothetical protein